MAREGRNVRLEEEERNISHTRKKESKTNSGRKLDFIEISSTLLIQNSSNASPYIENFTTFQLPFIQITKSHPSGFVKMSATCS